MCVCVMLSCVHGGGGGEGGGGENFGFLPANFMEKPQLWVSKY